MAFTKNSGFTTPQNMMVRDDKGLVERVVPFLPPWVSAAALWPVSALSHAMWGTDPAALPWATAGLTLASAGLTWLTTKVATGNAGRRGHSVVTVAGGSAWLTAATIVGPGTHPLLDMWLMGAPALALSWNIRRLLKVADAKEGKSTENEFFKAVKLAGTKVRGELTVGPNKVEMPLQLPPGELTSEDVSNAKGRIASGLSVSKNAVRVTPDPEHHDRATLTIIPEDMLKAATVWPGPSSLGGSIMDPIRVGLYEDGEPLEFWLPGLKEEGKAPRNATHGLVMGMNGSGKSHGAKLAWAEILTRVDSELWVADPAKGQQTLGAFLPYLGAAALNQEEGEEMMDALDAEITARADHLGKIGLDQWVPGCGLPYIVAWIEEASKLIRDSDTITDLVQTARSAGISILLSLQRASWTQIPTDTRAQLGIAWCFGLKGSKDADFALSDEALEAGANPGQWQNKKPGYCYLEAPGVDEDRAATPGRTFGGDDAQVLAALEAGLPYRKPFTPLSAKAKAFYTRQRARHSSSASSTAKEATVPAPTNTSPVPDVDQELLLQAAELVVTSQFGSTSMLQRKLRVSFFEASVLMGQLQELGVVGPPATPAEGEAATAQACAVLVDADELDDVLAAITDDAAPTNNIKIPADLWNGSIGNHDDRNPVRPPANPEPDLGDVDIDAELPPLAADEHWALPGTKPSLQEAQRLLRDVLIELRASGLTSVGPKDVPKAFFTAVRARSWVSPQMARMAETGELLAPTTTEGRYTFLPESDSIAA